MNRLITARREWKLIRRFLSLILPVSSPVPSRLEGMEMNLELRWQHTRTGSPVASRLGSVYIVLTVMSIAAK